MRIRRVVPILAALLALTLSPATASAQEQLPDSEASTILYRTALILEEEGAYELADELLDYILRRYPESAAARSIRMARAEPGRRVVEGDGRTELVVWSTLYGLWLGVAVPGMLGADDTGAYGLGLLVGGPIGFAAGSALSRRSAITEGQAAMITWGGGWGTWQGFGWAQVLDLGAECSTEPGLEYCEEAPSSEALFASMVAGGLVGTAGGVLAARRLDISPGDAALVNLGSLWGSWYGVVASVLAGVEDEDAFMATTLLAGNVGAGAGALLARAYPVSRSQARIASIIGVAGGLAGAGIDLIIQPEDEKVAIAIPTLTSTVALAVAAARIELGRAGGGTGVDGPGTGGEYGRGWSFGGPVVPRTVRGPDGSYRTALGVTLLSGRF